MLDTLLPERTKKRISLTALIDVVFILLMFFMLTSTFNKWKTITINTPVSSAETSNETPQVILLKEKGLLSIYNDGTPETIQFDKLTHKFNTQKQLIVVAEKTVNVQSIVNTMETLKKLGFSKLSLGNTDQ